jgi:hypothetical protein
MAEQQGTVETRMAGDVGSRERNTPPESMESSAFLDQFTILELREKGKNLILHYRFKGDKKTIEHNLTLRPGTTSDQIIHEASG